MKKALLLALAGVATLSLSACDTTSAIASYSVLPINTLTLQSATRTQGILVRVGDVTQDSSINDPKCRLLGPLDVTNGKSMSAYFKGALQAELLAAQAYDVGAQNVIALNVDQVQVTTVGGSASWKIGLTISSNVNAAGYSVNIEHRYKSSFTAVAACRNATSAFIPAVQEVIGAAIDDTRFAGLFAKD